MKLVIATLNKKKAEEIQRIANKIGGRKIEALCLSDIPEVQGVPQAEENGKTFLENARKKATYWEKILNMPVLAEDSGLEIDALDGAPGVYTKRCMATLCPGEDINVDKPGELYPKLLTLMSESGKSTRIAYWVSTVSLVFPETYPIDIQCKTRGKMCECAGEREFGFDQYFKPDGQSKTLAEMTPEEKDLIGPRLKAIKQVFQTL